MIPKVSIPKPSKPHHGHWLWWLLLLSLISEPLAQTVVQFKTPLGAVDVLLFDKEKPATVQNFLNYVTNGFYTNMFFHRWEPGFVIQGGGFSVVRRGTTNAAFSVVRSLGNVTNEYAVGPSYSNTYGTIAMAKLGGDPNSASSQWFFNLADNASNLDNQNGGFTVFGKVISGTNVLNRFNNPSPTNGIYSLDLTAVTSAFTAVPVVSNRPTFDDLVYADIQVISKPTAPTINAQPQSKQVVAGQSVEFSVTANGSETLFYQWTYNGIAIPNATNALYRIGNVDPSQVGSYSVVVTNPAGSQISQTATLAVLLLLDTQAKGNGQVKRDPDLPAYPTGTTVQLSAIASPGWRFVRWEEASIPASASTSITLQSNQSATAVFEPLPLAPFPLTVTTLTAESFEFTVAGEPGAVYEFEISQDLKSWTPWLRATNRTSRLTMRDPIGITEQSRFYRGKITGFVTP